MAKQIVRKVFYALMILFGVSLMVFCMMVLLPGDAVRAALATSRVSEEFKTSLRAVYGLNAPVYERYYKWLVSSAQGNLGYSFSTQSTVCEAVAKSLPVTLLVGFVALIFEMLIGIVGGVVSADKQGRWQDGIFSFLALLSVCTPAFLLVLAMQKIFVFDLGLFPLSGLMTPGANSKFLDILSHIALPCITLALLDAGRLLRFVRASMVKALNKDNIQWAHANGVSQGRLVWVHAFKNALLPLITYLGMSLPVLFTGTIIIESMFGLPGIGLLSYRGVMARDYPLVMGITMLVSLVTVMGNAAADICCTLADPQTADMKGK